MNMKIYLYIYVYVNIYENISNHQNNIIIIIELEFENHLQDTKIE